MTTLKCDIIETLKSVLLYLELDIVGIYIYFCRIENGTINKHPLQIYYPIFNLHPEAVNERLREIAQERTEIQREGAKDREGETHTTPHNHKSMAIRML